MSIDDRIKELVQKGSLFHRAPEDTSSLQLRSVYVTGQVQGLLDGQPPVAKRLWPVGIRASAFFDAFTANAHTTLGMDPHHKDSRAVWARNAPVESGICDLRVKSPWPQIRVFGAFASTNTFIALTYAPRLPFLDFGMSVRRCKGQWQILFPDDQPVVSKNVHDYIAPPVTAV